VFTKEIYTKRRKKLKQAVGSGMILMPGNTDVPFNYMENKYPFRQDSTFLYFWGLDRPGLVSLIDIDEDREYLFGNDIDLDDIVWMGNQPTLEQLASMSGVGHWYPLKTIKETVEHCSKPGKSLHLLPQYRAENLIFLTKLLGKAAWEINNQASRELIDAIVDLRSVKEKEEISEIELALTTTRQMHLTAMKMATPGTHERLIVGAIEGVAVAGGGQLAYPPVVSIDGQILHNYNYQNLLKKGKLLVIDAGAETKSHYASDITRTLPVGGAFSSRQKEIYEIVLNAEKKVIEAIRPGVPFRDLHILASSTIAEGLRNLHIMKGNLEDAVTQGAHALFFPCGIGHMMGLDVHDMENLGEDYVGYDCKTERSSQFGLSALRLARELQCGFTVTVEPGIYFIPLLIEQWRQEGRFKDYINYEKAETYFDFGGIRIEDNVLVTQETSRILGDPIPKSVNEIEKTMAGAG